jgi:histidinol-phosphate aminotransferase
MAKIGPYGGRYSLFGEQRQFVTAVAQSEDIKEEYVAPFAGSSDPLFRTSCAFTSSERSWLWPIPVTAEARQSSSAPS